MRGQEGRKEIRQKIPYFCKMKKGYTVGVWRYENKANQNSKYQEMNVNSKKWQ